MFTNTPDLKLPTLGSMPDGILDSVFIHHLAFVESPNVGSGTRIWEFAHVMSKAKIGENCNIGGHVFIESGAKVGNHVTVKNGISIWDLVEIEDDVFLGPHMIFTNDFMPRSFLKKKREDFLPTFVKKGATIGAGAVIVCGITIGQYAFVGAGSVVTKNIPPYGLVVGNPARLIGYLCQCTKTKFALNMQAGECPHCKTKNPLSKI